MVKGCLAFYVICLTSTISHSAHAIVNIESLRVRAGDATGWSSAGNIQASGASGNSDRAEVSLSGLIQHLDDGFSNLLVIGSEYGKPQAIELQMNSLFIFDIRVPSLKLMIGKHFINGSKMSLRVWKSVLCLALDCVCGSVMSPAQVYISE